MQTGADFNRTFLDQLEELGIQPDSRQLDMLMEYYLNLEDWNRRMNLTAINGLDDVCTRHFVDSLSIVKCIPKEELEKGLSVIDVGTGAGFPGMVLAIAFPGCRITLADSLNKRIRFLDDTIEKLGLTNVLTVHGRAEDLGASAAYREKFDLAVSRAVSSLPVLLEYCLPFVRTGGRFAAYKGEKLEAELAVSSKAIKVLGGTVRDRVSFELPGTDYFRELLVVEKTSATPARYPRKAGTPSASPIG